MSPLYELKLTPHLRGVKGLDELDQDRSGGIGAAEAGSMTDESLVGLLNFAAVDPKANGRDDFFRTIPASRIARIIEQGTGRRGPNFHAGYMKWLVARHSSHLVNILDRILGQANAGASDTGAGHAADIVLGVSAQAGEWGHLFDLLSYTHPAYVESRRTISLVDQPTRRLDKEEVQAGLRALDGGVMSALYLRSKDPGSIFSVQYVLQGLDAMTQAGLFYAFDRLARLEGDESALTDFVRIKADVDLRGLYEVLRRCALDESREGPAFAQHLVDRLETRHLENLKKIDVEFSKDNPPAILEEQEAESRLPRHFADSTLPRVTVETFDAEVIEASYRGPVLVLFGASWCPACNESMPYVEALAAKYRGRGLKVVIVDTKASPDLADRYGASTIPSFFLFYSGTVTDGQKGFGRPEELERMIQKNLPRAFTL